MVGVLADAGLLRMMRAPATQIAPPRTEMSATCSWRKITPRTSASAGMRNAAEDALAAPKRPAETEKVTHAEHQNHKVVEIRGFSLDDGKPVNRSARRQVGCSPRALREERPDRLRRVECIARRIVTGQWW